MLMKDPGTRTPHFLGMPAWTVPVCCGVAVAAWWLSLGVIADAGKRAGIGLDSAAAGVGLALVVLSRCLSKRSSPRRVRELADVVGVIASCALSAVTLAVFFALTGALTAS